MGNVIRKFKVKNKINAVKQCIGILGTDSDNDYIFINLKSRSYLDKTYNNILAQIKNNYKLPLKEKPVNRLSEIEKDIFELRREEDRKHKLILCYDTENPKYKEVENEIKKMEIIAHLVSFLDMDAIVENEEGKEINHWERFGIPKGDYLGLCKYLIAEDGLGLSEGSINLLSSEVMRMSSGEKTLGEKLLDAKEDVEKTKKVIDKIQIESDSDDESNISE